MLLSSLAAAITAVLVLTGCSSPQISPSPSTSGSSTTPAVEVTTAAPPPTTEAPVYKPATDQGPAENVPIPVLPDKAKEFSKEGLIAFTEYWYSALGYAFETGDPKPMMDISGPNCIACNNMSETILPWHSEGRWIVGGQMMVLSTNASFVPVEDGSYEVTALIRQNHVQFYRGDKSLADDPGQGPSAADQLNAAYDSNQWKAISVLRINGG
ncbi:hypothetical protein ART_1384 [Arthrobacter sp. PAMC 25486]|uniref:DUF6318 family protein n=1 Tax=Arthrobacter sp. PAMC 25486 TaxID=1494608 RepID=UPI0005360AB5|nr:DUF6318 family protein [Arthrobacter sp. PAMC 25486]AIY00983.1 hypothetical protein ART_1384 [Arthrobacter sp. PAMC 25486]